MTSLTHTAAHTILDELAAQIDADFPTAIEPDEVTAPQLAEATGRDDAQVKTWLDAQVKAGLMTRRLCRYNGKRAYAYKKVTTS